MEKENIIQDARDMGATFRTKADEERYFRAKKRDASTVIVVLLLTLIIFALLFGIAGYSSGFNDGIHWVGLLS